LLPVVLLTIFAYSITLAGCGNQPEATAPPTKTPTEPVTPTSALIAASQALPTFTATPTSLPTHTPLPTEPPTATPVPPTVAAAPVLSNTVTEEEMDDLRMANSSSAEDKDATGSDTQPEVAAPTRAPTPTPEPVTGPTEINPLTGLPVAASKLNRRPLGIKVPNFPWEARPQSGLSKADVVIEHEAEANLTRFTAIFYAGDSWEVGPTRSVRLVDGELMSIFKATLVTSGGHPAVKIRATEGKSWASGYKRIICPEEPFLGDGGALYRVSKPGRRYELTLYSDTPSLRNVVAARGVNQRPDFSNFWTFSDAPPEGGNSASYLRIVYKPQWSITEYRYDAGSKTYLRYDVGQATTDATTGQQIAPSNVLVLYANHVNSDIAADTHDPNNIYYSVIIQIWGEGSGKLFRDGKVYDIKWVRENPQQPNDRLILLDGAGNRMPLRPGSTWIQLVRPNGDVTIQ